MHRRIMSPDDDDRRRDLSIGQGARKARLVDIVFLGDSTRAPGEKDGQRNGLELRRCE